MRALVIAGLLTACSYDRPARIEPDASNDACGINNGGCAPAASCRTVNQQAVCTCNPGLLGDGRTCSEPWDLVTSIPNLALDEGWGFVTAAVGSKIYFAEEFDFAGKYFKSIDVNTSNVTDLPMPPPYNGSQNDFCACGGNESLITYGTMIYMFGNGSAVYDTNNNAWTLLDATMYPGQHFQAAGVEALNRAYLLGGSPVNTAAQYLNNGTFANITSLPFEAGWPGAFAIGKTIYVFAGGASRMETASFDASVDTNPWTPLANAPVDLYISPSVAQFGSTLILTSGYVGKLYTYDPASNTWPGGFDLPEGDVWKLLMVQGSVYALGQRTEGGMRSVVLYKLRGIPN